jgi:hypothetical protein
VITDMMNVGIYSPSVRELEIPVPSRGAIRES